MIPTTDSLTSSPRPTVAEAWSLLRRAKACPNFVQSSSCGSAACLDGKGHRGRVHFSDCVLCLREQDDRSALVQPAPVEDSAACAVSLPTALV